GRVLKNPKGPELRFEKKSEERNMRNPSSKRMVFILVATLLAVSINAASQASQAPHNETIWQKLKKSATQTGQNAAQQGGPQAQQVQQQVQQQIPIIGGQPNQMNAN